MPQRSTVGELQPGAESTSGIPRASMQHTKNGDPGTTASSNQNSPGQEAPGFTEQLGMAVKAIDDHSTWDPA